MTSREATGVWTRQDGVRTSVGTRAFTWAFALVQWPWLLKSLWGGPRAEKTALLARLDLPADALPNLGSWKADTFFLHAIVDRIAASRPAEVVELGCGASSLVAARALQLHGGGTLTSLDSHADFVTATRCWLQGHELTADIRYAPLGLPPGDWPGLWYQTGSLPGRIDLLLVDGPHWTLHPLVRGSAESLFDRIPVGGMVLADDAARPGER
ncbi:MAG: class I SAM-dependent methyltransferase, partial [Sandaracinobacteroides sp.]